MRPELRRALDGLTKKVLPVRPGDMIAFSASGNRLLVITCEHQRVGGIASSSAGQMIGGLMSGAGFCSPCELWLDWAGYDVLWNIHRAPITFIK